MLPNRELNSLELPFTSLLVLKLAGLTLYLTVSIVYMLIFAIPSKFTVPIVFKVITYFIIYPTVFEISRVIYWLMSSFVLINTANTFLCILSCQVWI